jgi:hypothetical protein
MERIREARIRFPQPATFLPSVTAPRRLRACLRDLMHLLFYFSLYPFFVCPFLLRCPPLSGSCTVLHCILFRRKRSEVSLSLLSLLEGSSFQDGASSSWTVLQELQFILFYSALQINVYTFDYGGLCRDLKQGIKIYV